ncbi:unnamed protein product [Urochloa humidicola]
MEHGCKHYRRRCKIVAPCYKQVFTCSHCHNEATVSGCPVAACVGLVRCRIESRHLELHRGRIGVRRLLLAALVGFHLPGSQRRVPGMLLRPSPCTRVCSKFDPSLPAACPCSSFTGGFEEDDSRTELQRDVSERN